MQLITDKWIDSLFIRSGVEALEHDIGLIDQFMTHANGCGLESLDSPTCKLVESALAERYPEHFKVGSGLEGISSLLDTLKKGLDGLKKMARGKAKPFMEKQSYGVAKEIKATYMAESWYKGKDAIGKPVDVSGLAKLIGAFTDYAGIATAIAADEKTLDDGFEKSADATDVLHKRAMKEFAEFKKLEGDELDKLAKTKLEQWKPLIKALSSELPELKHGSATKIDGLTIEQAKAVGKLMYDLIEWAYMMEAKAEDVRTYNGGLDQSLMDDFDEDDSDAFSTLFWNCWYWDSLSNANSEYADKTAKWAFSVAQQLEQLIINSVK